jgi:hypothetical protein
MGTMTWTGSGEIYTYNGAQFNNQAGGVFDAQSDLNMYHLGGLTTSFNNAGTYRKSASTGVTTMNTLSFVNTGIVNVETGTLVFLSGLLINADNAVLEGNGTINVTSATFTNEGDVHPGTSPGLLYFTDNYSHSATSNLNIEISGLNVGTQFDRFDVSDTATLDGTLNISRPESYLPNPGDQFVVMRYTTHSGSFAHVNGQQINDTLYFALFYVDTAVVLVTTNLVIPQLVIGQSGAQWKLWWSQSPNAIGYNVYQVNPNETMTLIGQTALQEFDITSYVSQPQSPSFFRVTARL